VRVPSLKLTLATDCRVAGLRLHACADQAEQNAPCAAAKKGISRFCQVPVTAEMSLPITRQQARFALRQRRQDRTCCSAARSSLLVASTPAGAARAWAAARRAGHRVQAASVPGGRGVLRSSGNASSSAASSSAAMTPPDAGEHAQHFLPSRTQVRRIIDGPRAFLDHAWRCA
jgi:hypothetical protein